MLYRDESNFRRLVDGARTIVVAGHKEPDEDSYGSSIAVYLSLRNAFVERHPVKSVHLVIDDLPELPSYIRELFPELLEDDMVVSRSEVEDILDSCDLFIGCDCHSVQRLFDEVSELASDRSGVRFWIDHHPLDGEEPSDPMIVNSLCSSASEVVMRTVESSDGLSLPPDAYMAVYLGIYGDTGGFSNMSADWDAIDAAARASSCMDAVPYEVSLACRKRTRDEMRAIESVYGEMETRSDGRLVYYVQRPTARHLEFSSSVNPVDVLTQLDTYEIAVSATRDDDGRYRVSLRSAGNYNVRRLAQRYGGGGHELASGFRGDWRDVTELIDLIGDMLEEDDEWA